MSDTNKIVADMVMEAGLEYAGRVIAGQVKPSDFVMRVLQEGLDAHEACAAKAATIQFSLSMQYGAVTMTMHRDGILFERYGTQVAIDWLMMHEADESTIRQHVLQSLLSDVFPFMGRRTNLPTLP